jgi:peptidoglycan/LPS O-acetylase OafA/YrhL
MTNTETLNTPPPRGILQSIGAVFAGLVAVFVLSLGTDVVLHAIAVYPPWFKPMSTPLWILATGYRVVYGIVGGYITARLAPNRPLLHALLLGFVGLALSIAGAASTWNQGPEFGPKWYPLAVVAMAVPCAWLGGRLRSKQ